MLADADAVARQEKRGIHDFQLNALFAQQPQNLRDARRFLEAVVGGDAYETRAECLNMNPLIVGDVRQLLGLDGQQDVVFMQDLVVFEVVQQRFGYGGRVADHEYRVTGDGLWRIGVEIVDKCL